MQYRITYVLVMLMLALPWSALAQVTGATISGNISDPSGAAVADASIAATNTQTGIATHTVSEASGAYVISALQPGTYNISVEKSGFKTKVLTGITLQVAQQATFPISLELGQVTTSVEVGAQTPLVQATSATVGTVIDPQRVVDLPLNTRYFGALAVLVPGTTIDRGGFAGGGLSSPFAGTEYSADGSRSSGNNVLIDGLMARALTGAGFSIQPTPDGVQEFKIETVTYDASLGMSSGSVINLITKSGTNDWHGSAYEFLRNDKLDARNFFANAKGEYRRNQFGFALGGPIRKNKTFFFVNYEPLRQILGSTATAYIPTGTQKSGNLSSSLTGTSVNLCGAGGPSNLNFDTGQLFYPATLVQMTCPAGSAKAGSTILTGTPIPGNIITSINPVAQKALALYGNVTPNRPGVPNYVNNAPSTRFDNTGEARVDQYFGEKDHLFGRYLVGQDNQVNPGALPISGSTQVFMGQNAGIGWTHTFSPTMVGDGRIGFQRNSNISTCLDCPYPAGTIASYGITGLTGTTRDSEKPPQFSFQPQSAQGGGGGFATFATVGDGPYTPLNDNDMIETYQYHLTKTKGSHTLTFGADLMFWQSFRVQSPYAPQGLFTFNGQYSSLAGELPNDTLAPFADFLLGYPNTAARTFKFQYMNQHGGWFWNYFAQDDIRVSPNLTINAGLRWEYRRPAVDKQNALMSFLPIAAPFSGSGNALLLTALPDAQNDALCTNPADSYLIENGHCLVATSQERAALGFTGRRQQSIIQAEKTLFAPRLGLSWRPFKSDRVVIHTGAGIFYDLAALNNQHYGDNNPVFAPSQLFQTTFGAPAVTQIQNVFAGTGGIPNPSSQFVAAFLDPNYKTPKVEQWSFGIESQLSRDIALQVYYIGNHGYDLGELLDFANQPLPGVGPIQPRRPYPDFNSTLYTTSGADSSYNSLQVQVRKRFSQGLTILASYTWSKQLDNDEGDENYTGATGYNGPQSYSNFAANWGPGETDVRNRFVASAIWELPVGRGHALLGNANNAVNAILGGWNVSGILTDQSGFPLTVVSAFDYSNTGSVSPRPDRICNGVGSGSVNQFFNTSCFSTTALQTAFQQGNPRFGNSGKGILEGPRFNNLDFAVLKHIPLTERFRMELRGEAYDIFNHPNFLDPNTAVGSTLFGVITSSRNGRDVQVALKLLF